MPEANDQPLHTDAETGVQHALQAPRIVIDELRPCVDGGRFPVKAVVGQPLQLSATIFIDGHDQLAARVLWSLPGDDTVSLPLQAMGNDHWQAEFTPPVTGVHRYAVEAWLDVWGSFRAELQKKHAAGQPLRLEIEEGRALVLAAAWENREDAALAGLAHKLPVLDDASALPLLLSEQTSALMHRHQARRFVNRSATVVVDVERLRAGYASWYELFPRSQSDSPQRHGRFDDVISRLPAIQAMGFDVLYFPPIHPIGDKNRKGRNNRLRAEPGDPGSPYAIGNADGGHDAVHRELGGIQGFRRLRAACEDHGLELALDFAVQCSPDHPWLAEHPGWFSWRPDGSIRYAENPPKKYEDIVNVDFYAEEAQPDLWLALRDIVEFWIGEGVRLFRVDNPHTKPLPFWQWLIADIRSRYPDAVFLAEAFTRPAMMSRLAKVGFGQSYTYFTWRNNKFELTQYLHELTTAPMVDYYRPHFFVNTPDINPHFLQTSGRAGFLIRAALAATTAGLWGVYSGFELCESAALPGREEYLDSEKYQIKPRDWRAPGNIIREISRLNHIRRNNACLQSQRGLCFYNAWNEAVIYYGKPAPDRSHRVLTLVSLDPHQVQETWFEAPLWEFGLADDGVLEVEDLMNGARFLWRGKHQHWRFDPHHGLPFAVLRVQPLEEQS